MKKQSSMMTADVEFDNRILFQREQSLGDVTECSDLSMIRTQSAQNQVSHLTFAQMRRATSYCGAQTQSSPSQDDCSDDLASLLIGRTTNLNGKHRRRIQAQ